MKIFRDIFDYDEGLSPKKEFVYILFRPRSGYGFEHPEHPDLVVDKKYIQWIILPSKEKAYYNVKRSRFFV